MMLQCSGLPMNNKPQRRAKIISLSVDLTNVGINDDEYFLHVTVDLYWYLSSPGKVAALTFFLKWIFQLSSSALTLPFIVLKKTGMSTEAAQLAEPDC